MISASWLSGLCVVPSWIGLDLVIASSKKNSRGDGMSFLKLEYRKTGCLSCISFLPCSFWQKLVDMLWPALKRGMCGKELVFPVDSHWGTEDCQQPHVWAWEQLLLPLCLEMNATFIDNLIEALWETRSQKNLPKLCPGSLPIEIMRKIFVVFSC